MIKIEKQTVTGFGSTIRGMRNPMNSWDKSDSKTDGTNLQIGPNDLDLMLKLAGAGPVEGKFRRMIAVYVDITAPLYWWKEFDTYKVGTVANSCSTMHKIHDKEFTLEDFSHEHLIDYEQYACNEQDMLIIPGAPNVLICGRQMLELTISALNFYRHKFLEEDLVSRKKQYWWQMIQLLPSSYNQKRTIMLNYEVLTNIYQNRLHHKLDEWRELCQWIETLPYSEIITCGRKEAGPNDEPIVSKSKENDSVEYLCYKGMRFIFRDGKYDGYYKP